MQVEVKVGVRDYLPITAMAVVALNRQIRVRGNANISGAGSDFAKKFGCRTQTQKRGPGYRVRVYIKPGYGKVFEFGSTSVGKPMLWIGIGNAKHVRAKTYRKQGHKLFRPGLSRVLIDRKDGQIKYVGIKSVSVTPRLSIRKIVAEEARKFGFYMAKTASGSF
jgi:hypothetical protein